MMVLNPFIDNLAIDDISEWIGDKSVIEAVKFCVGNRTNACILGPEGSGKTSLLKTALPLKYRSEMVERKKLIYFAELSNRNAGNDMCDYLADRFESSLNALIKDKTLLAELQEIIKNEAGRQGLTRLQNILSNIHDCYGFFMVIVMDNFELFLSSTSVTQEHHEVLRALIEQGCIQCIVSTNYDLSQDSLPADIRGSYLIQKFNTYLEMPSLTEEDVSLYLKKKQSVGRELVTSDMAHNIYLLSGGNPKLVNIVSKYLFESATENDGKPAIKIALQKAREECTAVMDNWCKLLTQSQLSIIDKIAEQCTSNGEYGGYDFSGDYLCEIAAELLRKRGFLKRYCHESGERIVSGRDYYLCFNSLLLQRYCKEGRMRAAAARNPFIKPIDPHGPSGHDPGPGPVGGTTIYIDTVVVDNSQNKTVNQINAITGISMHELVQWIANPGPDMLVESPSQNQRLLGDQLAKHFESFLTGSRMPDRGSESEEEYALIQDEHFSAIGSNMLPDISVNEDNEIEVEVDAKELLTIDERFEAIRSRRPALTDEILNAQSERCQLYLKLSVIVEDALAVVGMFVEDYSPQLVLYGKALEQSLRDLLFPYFKKDSVLCVYDVQADRADASSANNFSNLTMEKTFIGNYLYMMKRQREYLSKQCADNRIQIESKSQGIYEWKYWWKCLAGEVEKAKDIRNKADHANHTPPMVSDLNEMCTALFGNQSEAGILSKLTIFNSLLLLTDRVEIDPTKVQTFENTDCELEIRKVKQNNSLDCIIAENGYAVKISKSSLGKFMMNNPGIVFAEGMHLIGHLGLYDVQDGHSFFHAKVLSVLS